MRAVEPLGWNCGMDVIVISRNVEEKGWCFREISKNINLFVVFVCVGLSKTKQ